MQLFVFPVAPNPTRVRLYLAEKRVGGATLLRTSARSPGASRLLGPTLDGVPQAGVNAVP